MTIDGETIDTGNFGTISVFRRDCPLCRRDNDAAPASRYSYGPWQVKECDDCGFVYIDRMPPYQAQAETMAWQ